MLLALIAEGLGADLDDYDIPAERLDEYLSGTGGPAADPEARRLEVLAMAEAVGGEVG